MFLIDVENYAMIWFLKFLELFKSVRLISTAMKRYFYTNSNYLPRLLLGLFVIFKPD